MNMKFPFNNTGNFRTPLSYLLVLGVHDVRLNIEVWNHEFQDCGMVHLGVHSHRAWQQQTEGQQQQHN